MENSQVNNYVLDEKENEDDDDDGEFMGFCVYGKEICIYGNDGLFTTSFRH